MGRHELKVERYGYEDFAATFDVYENRDTVIDLRQFPASFRILGLRLLPGAFDPGDPGHLGACAIVIETSAPGSGRLSVLDESGREVRSLENLAFNEKYTRATCRRHRRLGRRPAARSLRDYR